MTYPADAVVQNVRHLRATVTLAYPPDHTEFTTVLGRGFDQVERAA